MLARILLVFTLVPLAELYLLMELSQIIQPSATIALVLLTGVLGAVLTRFQGVKIFQKIQATMAEGRMPGNELLEGLLVLIGGALLITPGILTDLLGFSLVLSPTRLFYREIVKRKLKGRLERGENTFFVYRG